MNGSQLRVAFVSNTGRKQRSGGFSGIGTAITEALSSVCDLHFVGPINPAANWVEHFDSKSRRLFGSKGAFFFFSDARLRRIAAETEKYLSEIPHDLCFFHGFTPWINVRCDTPYIAWSDCTFLQYMSVFHDRTRFDEVDLKRIEDREKEWLKGASRVFFRNHWAAESAVLEYGLDPTKVVYVGNCGIIDPPVADAFGNGREFLFISTDFGSKGGLTATHAFRRVRRKYPDIHLNIVGDRPPSSVFTIDRGVTFKGFLRKEVPAEASELSAILARSRALLHPTRADTNPMVLIEAGYFGCPAIATRICGIPEMVDDGKTGILIDYPASVSSVVCAMERLLSDDQSYGSMRQAVRAKMCDQFSKASFQNRVRASFCEVLKGKSVGTTQRLAQRTRIAYVSNLPKDLVSGGFSAMNVGMFSALEECSEVNYLGPINPMPSLGEHVTSKLSRGAGLPGRFFFFSKHRLARIAAEAAEKFARVRAGAVFFHGFTPWIAVKSNRPYAAWSDCTFREYINVYHDREAFSAADLRRIEEAEAQWLQGARKVLFTNQWAADQAIRYYALDSAKVGVVGMYGAVDPPLKDAYDGSHEFAFISTNFELKGGHIVVDAIKSIRGLFPKISLLIVGDRPPASVLKQKGISWLGFLRKEHPIERRRFFEVLGRVRAVIHPTRADIFPLLLIEAGYFGCPALSTRLCGIPEIIQDGTTGVLLDGAPAAEAVAQAIRGLLSSEDSYLSMRAAVRDRMSNLFSRASFAGRVRCGVLPALED
jgi:glycosyltransferase involved in cell wall biosynthesis